MPDEKGKRGASSHALLPSICTSLSSETSQVIHTAVLLQFSAHTDQHFHTFEAAPKPALLSQSGCSSPSVVYEGGGILFSLRLSLAFGILKVCVCVCMSVCG